RVARGSPRLGKLFAAGSAGSVRQSPVSQMLRVREPAGVSHPLRVLALLLSAAIVLASVLVSTARPGLLRAAPVGALPTVVDSGVVAVDTTGTDFDSAAVDATGTVQVPATGA